MSATSGGLGRGLAAILTGPSIPPEAEGLRGRFIESAMDSLNAQRPLEYCGYIHGQAGDVDVTLRSPELRSLHPTGAYRLFAALSEAASVADGRHEFTVGEITCHSVMRTVDATSGLFFFGDAHLTSSDVDRLAAFCAVYAPVIIEHDIAPRADENVHLVMDQHGGAVHAEVTVNDNVGFGSAQRTHHAAAQAGLAALCQDAKLVDVGEVRSSEGVSSFVVAAGESGRMAMGAAPVAAGPDAAAAVAALRAARWLSD